MDKIRKLKRMFLFNSNDKVLMSDGVKALNMSNIKPGIIKNTFDFFSVPNIPNDFFVSQLGGGQYRSLIKTLIEYDFLTDVIRKPLLYDSFTIISNEQYMNNLQEGLSKLGIRSIQKICINMDQKAPDVYNFVIDADSVSLIYLPHNSGILFELLKNYDKYNFQKIIIGHVHLDNIWSVFLDPPRTACPQCFISRLSDNMPLFKYVAQNDFYYERAFNNAEMGIQFLLRNISSLLNTDSLENPKICGFINIFDTDQLTIKREQVIKKYNCSCLANKKVDKNDLVSNHVGIIRGIGQVPLNQTDPNIVMLSGRIGGENLIEGGAADWDWERCTTRTIGECLERYCWMNYTKEIVSSSWLNLCAEQRLPLEGFHIYSKEQYLKKAIPYSVLNQEEVIDWLPVYQISTNKKVFAPAKILLGNRNVAGQDIYPRTSNGIAAGPSIAFATEHAILELIERDTVSRNWLKGGPFLKVNEGILKLSSTYNRCVEAGLESQVFTLPNNYNIPVIMCRLVPNDTKDIIISYGCSSGKSYLPSIDKAILEAILMRIYLRDLIRKSGIIKEKHGGLHHIKESQNDNPPLFLRKAQYASTIEVDKEFTLSNLHNSDNIYYHELTLDDVRMADIYVVRAWSPNMLGFVRNREVSPVRLLNCEVEDLIDVTLPFE